MTLSSSEQSSLLDDLRRHLQAAGYSAHSVEHLCIGGRQFLRYIRERKIRLEAVQPPNVAMYMRRQLQDYRRRHGRMPTNRKGWRTWCTDGVVQLLRFTHQQWPPARLPRNRSEARAQTLCRDYRRWLADCRGLAASTINGYLEETERFLSWHTGHGGQDDRLDLSLRHVDQYLQFRAAVLRRTTLKLVSLRLSGFLRFLHRAGHLSDDLSRSMIHPTLYEFENIPSVLKPEEITQILKVTRRDRSPRGRRDFAILTLLATYGLRAGEIVRLALDDIDWRTDTIVIRHSKVRGTTVLPLLPAAGEALLSYLRSGRPKTTAREVFIRMSAPLQGFSQKSVLHALVSRRIAAAGIRPTGKRGPHVFRHAHAVGLLRAAVPIKTISDLLGHRTSRSTATYLKLDSEELRAVALPLPIAGGAS
ncbi:MAG: tyrosine-type recombinase/integrase [Woeseiaceae bacterium]